MEQKLLPPAHGKAAHRSQPSSATSGQGDGDGAHLAGGHRAHLGGRTVPGRGRYSSTWGCHSFTERKAAGDGPLGSDPTDVWGLFSGMDTAATHVGLGKGQPRAPPGSVQREQCPGRSCSFPFVSAGCSLASLQISFILGSETLSRSVQAVHDPIFLFPSRSISLSISHKRSYNK